MASSNAAKYRSLSKISTSVLKLSEVSSLNLTPFEEIDPQIYADWYLKSCYPELPFHDEKLILEFLVSEASKASGADCLLELGCGPTVSHTLPFVPHVKSFILSDYLESNLIHIQDWVGARNTAHNWALHTAYVLKKEKRIPSSRMVKEREDLLRKRLKGLMVCDLLSRRPIRKVLQFPVVTCFYATEQAAQDESEWLDVMQNLSSLLLPGGRLYLSCVYDSEYYAIHDQELNTLRIPIVPIKKRLVEKGLRQAGFSLRRSEINICNVKGLHEEGLNGVVLVSAVKAE